MSLQSCPNCDAEMRAGDVFCGECGARVETPRCSGCGAAMPGNDRFCGECGQPATGAGTRSGDRGSARGKTRRRPAQAPVDRGARSSDAAPVRLRRNTERAWFAVAFIVAVAGVLLSSAMAYEAPAVGVFVPPILLGLFALVRPARFWFAAIAAGAVQLLCVIVLLGGIADTGYIAPAEALGIAAFSVVLVLAVAGIAEWRRRRSGAA